MLLHMATSEPDGDADVEHRVVLLLVDLVLDSLALSFDLALRRGASGTAAAQRHLRRALEHDSRVDVEIDPRGPDVAVADAQVGGKVLLGLDRAVEGGARRDRAAAGRRLAGEVDLVVVGDEAAGDAERPEGAPVE